MTISTAYSWDSTRDTIITSAWRLCGLLDFGQSLRPEQISGSSVFLNNIYKALQNEGTILRTVERTTVTTTASTAAYTAAADTMDVEFPGYVTSTTAGAGTTRLTRMTRADYMELSDKTTEGTPSRMLVDDTTSSGMQLILYPVPDSNTASFTYQRVRMLRDVDSGSVTEDLHSLWLQCITYRLAHDIALSQSLPPAKAQYLLGVAEKEKQLAMGSEAEGGEVQFLVAHRGPWSGSM